jgi:16S rRNA (cytosine967-C5)-methyltransferase
LKRRRSPTRPPGAREAALEILLRVERSGAYASVLLDAWEPRLSDPRESALLHEIVLGVLRRRSLLDHLVAGSASRAPEELDPEVRAALRIGAYGLFFLDRVPDFAAVDSAVELVRSGPRHGAAGFVNGVLRSLGRGGRALLPPEPASGDVAGLALHHSHPGWWVRRLVDRMGFDAAGAVLAADNRPAATVLRVAGGASGRETLRDELAAAGIRAEPCSHVEEALRVSSGSLGGCAALRDGRAWVQDEAAQLVGYLFERPLGARVADLCAAPGGKSLQLAEWLADDGVLVALDRHPGRLRRLVRAARRVRATRVLAVRANMAAPHPPLREGFDQILLDAPCSGSGTLRRHPEIRWRLREEDLKLLAARQLRLLATAADLLRPGGTLVYAVCSLEPEEGEQVVGRFLRSRADFRREDPRPTLPRSARDFVTGDGFLRTSPERGGLDGFFAARLRRADASAAEPE